MKVRALESGPPQEPFLFVMFKDGVESTWPTIIMGHLQLIMGHLEPMMGHLALVMGHLELVMGHLELVTGHLEPIMACFGVWWPVLLGCLAFQAGSQ